MPSSVPALAVPTAGAPFELTTIERRDLRPNDVLIDIAFAGICHSDVHQARDEWGGSTFPMVPGHEIAGVVSAVGPQVTRFAIGDRAGVGCIVDSCGECANCEAGDEQYCLKGMVPTYNGREYDGDLTYGGYSTQIIVNEDYVLHIPDAIPLDVAAPLLCAGITLYSPLAHWDAGPGKRVAIIGMGGLGHMGVKIAHAMGAEVTVLSQSLAKEADSKRFGAVAHYATSDKATFKTLTRSFDLIVNTLSVPLEVDTYLRLLRRNGAIVHVGMPENPNTTYTPSALAGRGRLSIAGSMIGGIQETQEMLDFCALHDIAAEIEKIKATADQIDDAYDRVVRSDVRYRFVIDIATLG
jgi:uncharacterized zinc-type alcohol dehydrogenase-like protein